MVRHQESNFSLYPFVVGRIPINHKKRMPKRIPISQSTPGWSVPGLGWPLHF